jgi:uncharacterized protein (TIGR02452 family)
MFRLLNWIPGCRSPRYVKYYYNDSEKDSPLISEITSPTFSHVPPPVRPIPESRYQRRLIDEDFSPVRRDFSYDTTKYRRYPMKEDSSNVPAGPSPETSPQPRVVSRGSSRRSHSSVAGSSTYPNNSSQDNASRRRQIANETLAAIERGEIQLQGSTYRFHDVISHSIENTIFFPPDSPLATWSTSAPPAPSSSPAQLELCEGSTPQRARALLQELNANVAGTGGDPARIGVLSFASATKPGGGFLSGAEAQEESITRVSTLYTSLVTPTANQFYELHKKDRRGGFYSHAMIFSPSVIVLRDDAGAWLPPHQIEVVTCAAVNAGVVRERAGESPSRGSDVGTRIESVMRERMARILFVFEQQGLRNIVLGSFGTGVFRNDVSMVADIWFDLLAEGGARFMHSFDRVIFGIINKRTAETFKAVFESRIEAQNSTARSRDSSFGTPGTVLRVVD